jgi:hypothetical protein
MIHSNAVLTTVHAGRTISSTHHVNVQMIVYTAWDWNNGDLTEDHFITSACSQGPMLAASQQRIPHVVSDNRSTLCYSMHCICCCSSREQRCCSLQYRILHAVDASQHV